MSRSGPDDRVPVSKRFREKMMSSSVSITAKTDLKRPGRKTVGEDGRDFT
jgi:hypothetical protein